MQQPSSIRSYTLRVVCSPTTQIRNASICYHLLFVRMYFFEYMYAYSMYWFKLWLDVRIGVFVNPYFIRGVV